MFTNNFHSEFNHFNWTNKAPELWQPCDVADWIRHWAQQNEVQDIEVAHLLYNQMSGAELCQMQREYFASVCPQFGSMIYDSLQSLVNQFRHNETFSYMTFDTEPSSAHCLNQPPTSLVHHSTHDHLTNTSDLMQFDHVSSNYNPYVFANLENISSTMFDSSVVSHNYSPSYTSGEFELH